MKVAHEVRNRSTYARIVLLHISYISSVPFYWTPLVNEIFPFCFCSEQGAVLCLATNPGGGLLASGGADGRVCLWQWGADQFLHQGETLPKGFLGPIIC